MTTTVPSPAPVAPTATDAGKALAHNLRAVRTEYTTTGTSVVLVGDGRLVAKNIESAGSRRVYLDFPGVSPNVAPVTQVGKGGIERIRVGLNSRDPLVTRVVIDLNRDAAHALSTTPGDWREVRVNFSSGAQGPQGAEGTASARLRLPARRARLHRCTSSCGTGRLQRRGQSPLRCTSGCGSGQSASAAVVARGHLRHHRHLRRPYLSHPAHHRHPRRRLRRRRARRL